MQKANFFAQRNTDARSQSFSQQNIDAKKANLFTQRNNDAKSQTSETQMQMANLYFS